MDTRIYVVGGWQMDDKFLRSLDSFDIVTGTWEHCSPMHVTRAFVCAAALGGHLYAIGGHTGKLYVSGGNTGETVLASVEEYTAELDSWALVTPMPGPRSNHRMVTHGACIYVIGGYSGRRRLDDGHGLTADVQHYSSGSDTWRSVVAPLMQPLGAMDACVVAGLPVVRRLSGR
ncbi:hypothetical protein MRX96_013471 [Rhipicephalus microplus]